MCAAPSAPATSSAIEAKVNVSILAIEFFKISMAIALKAQSQRIAFR
jgi:hypothetical protein